MVGRPGFGAATAARVVLVTLLIASIPGLKVTALDGQQPSTPTGGLRIVVLEGEDGVNILDQKTAVAPVVEVRDRNNLPVAGATVTFLLSRGAGNAVLNNGVRQVTMTTNALGRATVAINPVGRGAIQIQVTASYQGQTAAATISQTNFANAAQAAQGASGGGGLSTAAIVGIAGAGVGATVAAVTLTKAPPCVFSVSPLTITAGGAAASSSVNVNVDPADCEPKTWSANTTSPFLTVSPTGGSGTGTVTIGVQAIPLGGAARTGTVSVAGQTVSVNQSAPCTFNLSTTSLGPIAGTGGSATVTVTATPAGCSPSTWTASSGSSFIGVSPTSGNGNGTVTVTASANPTGNPARNGTVTIAGRAVTVAQNQAFAPCNSQQVSGADAPETRTIEMGRTSGSFTFNYNTYSQPDRMIVRYGTSTLFDTGCVGAAGSRRLSFSGSSSTISVQVIPNCAGGFGTGWDFSLSCS